MLFSILTIFLFSSFSRFFSPVANYIAIFIILIGIFLLIFFCLLGSITFDYIFSSRSHVFERLPDTFSRSSGFRITILIDFFISLTSNRSLDRTTKGGKSIGENTLSLFSSFLNTTLFNTIDERIGHPAHGFYRRRKYCTEQSTDTIEHLIHEALHRIKNFLCEELSKRQSNSTFEDSVKSISKILPSTLEHILHIRNHKLKLFLKRSQCSFKRYRNLFYKPEADILRHSFELKLKRSRYL